MDRRWTAIAMTGIVAMMTLLSCSEDDVNEFFGTEGKGKGIALTTPGNTTELYSVANKSNTLSFTAYGAWKASCTAKWLTFSPREGNEGKQTITVTTTQTNRTKGVRTAQLTIESNGKKETVNIRQRGEYGIFDRDEYTIPAKGGKVKLTIETNIIEELRWGWNDTAEEMIPELKAIREPEKARTRAISTSSLDPFTVVENTSRDARIGAFFLSMRISDKESLLLDTLWVYQEGADNGYVSTDYRQNGKVKRLQKASLGNGIPVVLMGDGFVDTEISDGTYDNVMQQTLDNLFSEEPIRSLRDYFNVYQVTLVSPTNNLNGVKSTRLGAVPDHQTMKIDVNADSVITYVKRVEGIDSLNTLAVVIPNTNIDKGVTYMFRSNKKELNYAIAMCPLIDGVGSERFRQVLTHEAIGHGFAKLADEYSRQTEGSATDDDIKELKDVYHKAGWYMNVDSEKDSTKVLWTKFIYDTTYAAEKIGTYEGGYTYFKNIFRPSEKSMMNANDAPFNAPSRQIIYYKVMKMALGKTPSYEEFKAFDKEHLPQRWSYEHIRTRTPWQQQKPFAPPIIINR